MFSFITRSSINLAVRASNPQLKRSITLLATCKATSKFLLNNLKFILSL